MSKNLPALSPHKSGSNTQHFVSIASPHSNADSSRGLLKEELSGKLLFNQERVFERLDLADVPIALVNACAASFSKSSSIIDAKNELASLDAQASRKSEAELDAEVEDEYNNTVKGTQSKARERRMYEPLNTIFNHIETFGYPTVPRKFDRQWVSMGSSALTQEGDSWSFPKVIPDFTLLDISEEIPRSAKQKPPHRWRDRSAFCKVKPTAAQGPVPTTDAETVKRIVTQAADYARLHLSAQPFQLFSIGLLIFGSRFCVVIFDRGGAVFSPVCDMWSDLPVFIRVIRRLSCDLSSIELGQDPTVRVVPNVEAKKYQRIAQSLAKDTKGVDQFPIYAVTLGQGDQCWYTLGFPIWSSLSLLGRGTTIWRVCEPSKPEIRFVLKNAWRSSERLAESMIYESIQGSHPGLAEFQVGADVVFPGQKDRHISVNNLRDKNVSDEGATFVFHRLLLKTFGRPLWEFNTEIELLKGFRAAIQGHRFLYEQGILHRDISAGNVLLAAIPQEGREGFIMDVEFAHIAHSSIPTTTTTKHVVEPVQGPSGVMTPEMTTHKKFNVPVPVKRGAIMTGTIQFMAHSILKAISRGTEVEHQVWHDLESFVWVLCYCVIRRFISRPSTMEKEQRQKLNRMFHFHFGQMNILSITSSRSSTEGPLTVTETFPGMCSVPMENLFSELSKIHYLLMGDKFNIHHFQLGENDNGTSLPTRLSYDTLTTLLDRTIDQLAITA